MRPRKKNLAEPYLDMKDGEQLIKVIAVILRDHTLLSFEDVIMAFTYCWRQTESVAQADAREAAATST